MVLKLIDRYVGVGYFSVSRRAVPEHASFQVVLIVHFQKPV